MATEKITFDLNLNSVLNQFILSLNKLDLIKNGLDNNSKF